MGRERERRVKHDKKEVMSEELYIQGEMSVVIVTLAGIQPISGQLSKDVKEHDILCERKSVCMCVTLCVAEVLLICGTYSVT